MEVAGFRFGVGLGVWGCDVLRGNLQCGERYGRAVGGRVGSGSGSGRSVGPCGSMGGGGYGADRCLVGVLSSAGPGAAAVLGAFFHEVLLGLPS